MTHYVVTRWYRAPELLLVCRDYSYPVDMWAAACLAVEMVTGKPLFPGKDYIHQINLIVELLGTPNLEKDLPPSTSTEAVAYLSSLPSNKEKRLQEYVPELRARFDEPAFFDSFDEPTEGVQHSPAEAFAMFETFVMGMLRYCPERRMTAKQAIAHPWLTDVRGPETEIPGCEAGKVFSWDKDSVALSLPELRALFLEEIRHFHRPKR
ncbi:extracellular signal-regulated kinase 1/2 [Angomonas deanei]|nr:extracellular signal-regulated kinase 1/2 [Angomonas deanei]|eukprot:EPY38794.1 extracellular signal-regulated kinase 1/2 [Angomonas deanei]